MAGRDKSGNCPALEQHRGSINSGNGVNWTPRGQGSLTAAANNLLRQSRRIATARGTGITRQAPLGDGEGGHRIDDNDVEYNVDTGIAFTGDDDIDSKRRLSCWVVTVNPNLVYEGPVFAEDVGDKLEEAGRTIFTHPEFRREVFKWLIPPKDAPVTQIYARREVGIEKWRIHIHIMIVVYHTGRLHLDYKKVRDLFNAFLVPGKGNPYGIVHSENYFNEYTLLPITSLWLDIKHYQLAQGFLLYLSKGMPIDVFNRRTGEMEQINPLANVEYTIDAQGNIIEEAGFGDDIENLFAEDVDIVEGAPQGPMIDGAYFADLLD